MTSAPNYARDKQNTAEFTKIFYGIESVVKIALHLLAQADNRVDAYIDQTRPSLIIDIARLRDAFLDAKNRGVRLRYITEITKNNLIVSIKDDGTGIDPGIMPRLFTKFLSKSESGIGLGLYISKNLIETHGGEIWGESNTDGNGATFSFRTHPKNR